MPVRELDQREVAAATELAVHLNAAPEHHIGYFGANAAEVRQHIAGLQTSGVRFLGAFEHDRLVGLLALEESAELGRAWLHGPLIDAPDWHALAAELYAAGTATLAPAIHEHEIFCDVANQRCLAFAAAHGFALYGDWHILCFGRAQLAGAPDPTVQPLARAQHAALRQLHDRLFPTANTTSRLLLDGIGEHAQVFTCLADDQLLGYIALSVEPTSGEAFIDFVGVTEAARGLGIGQRLLQRGLHWLFGWPGVGEVCLAVRTDNPAAQRLYERTGFRRERTLRAFRRPVPAPEHVA